MVGKKGRREGRKARIEKISVIDWENTLLPTSSVFVIFIWAIIYIDMNYMINKAKRMREQVDISILSPYESEPLRNDFPFITENIG